MSIAEETDESASLVEAVSVSELRFNWGATAAASAIAVCATLVLLVLGSGAGLVLLPQRVNGAHAGLGVFTLGAVYFLATQAFGMAAGGHIVGRLIGAQIETSSEENFRAATHGLAVWASSILLTLALVTVTSTIATKSALDIASLYGAASLDRSVSTTTDYLVDALFRSQPIAPQHASLAGLRFAQADTQQGTDATQGSEQAAPASPSSQQQQPAILPPEGLLNPSNSGTDSASSLTQDNSARPHILYRPGDLERATPPPSTPSPEVIAADKKEVARILDTLETRAEFLSVEDRDRIAVLVAQDANISYEAATARANDVQTRVRDARAAALEEARKTTSFVALWLAISLIFGAVVSVIAAVSARWEDDMQEMFSLRRLLSR